MSVTYLENEIRIAIQQTSLLLIRGCGVEERKVRAIREKLYKDLESVESAFHCPGGPLSLHLLKQIQEKESAE